MASPRIEVFTVYNLSTGAPLTGAAGGMSFTAYKDDQGTNLSAPSITEIGGGCYKFTSVPADPARGIVYVVQTGGNPAYFSRYVRPEDWITDNVQDLMDEQFGRWQIVQAGPDANRLVLYRQDGVTVLKKFALADLAGAPSITNVFSRTPL